MSSVRSLGTGSGADPRTGSPCSRSARASSSAKNGLPDEARSMRSSAGRANVRPSSAFRIS